MAIQHVHAYDANRATYPLAILVKDTAFSLPDIARNYIGYFAHRGLDTNQFLIIGLPYPTNGKNPTKKEQKEFLDELLPILEQYQVEHIYCADSIYFRTLVKETASDKFLGSRMQCQYDPKYNNMTVTLGLSYRALAHNPNQEERFLMGLKTYADVVLGQYVALGHGIIQTARYPVTVTEIKDTLSALHQYPVLAIDIEAFSLQFQDAGVGTIAFAWNPNNGAAFCCDYVPKGEGGFQTRNPQVRELLKQFFIDYQGTTIWHGGTYDLRCIIYALWMKNDLDYVGMMEGLEVMTRSVHDTMLLNFLATNSTTRVPHDLKSNTKVFAGNYAVDVKDITKVPVKDLLQYNLVDALATFWLFERRFPEMQKDKQTEVYDLMLDSLKVIVQMELVGLPVNPMRVDQLAQQLEIAGSQLEREIAGSPEGLETLRLLKIEEAEKHNAQVNKTITVANSARAQRLAFSASNHHHLRKLVYDVMGFEVVERTDTGKPSTQMTTLENLLDTVPESDPRYHLLKSIRSLAEMTGVRKTFVPAFKRAVLKGNGRAYVHGTYRQGKVVSGRMSSGDPNMQNLPSGSKYGKAIKRCVQAPDGWLFCGADFESLEDKAKALRTRDPNMLRIYEEGFDSHGFKAFHYWPEKYQDVELTPEAIDQAKKTHGKQRKDSKAVTFAMNYDGTVRTLMKNSGFSQDEAERVYANYQKMYQVSLDWSENLKQQANQQGYVTGAFGLRLRTPILAKTILDTRNTPYSAIKEAKTANNMASGQSYGLLTNRSMNATMQRVWNSPYRLDILPCGMIHDANYFLVRAKTDVMKFLNDVLIEEMAWQDLSEIQHETVHLSAQLDLFWPSWACEHTLKSNGLSEAQILDGFRKHRMNVDTARALQVGDQVNWINPDSESGDSTYFITEILTDLGFIEDFSDNVIISDADGNCYEVAVAEII